ncbi:hypothetical protein [Streptomyces sp. TS71-3]|uniref:hypothetical protein n=1 Tax=Streptomyces sp. TS71-3 TaxID=2733862 RepID=UPI001B26F1FF|nr:hypothetical protein [Streptomyces sp. TS71-3]GHJ36014.1 hypothetical protein Sm713_16230 [Streptomyces sp. TS71-3]
MEQLVGVLVKVLLIAFVVGMFTLVIRVFVRGRKEDARIREEWSELARVATERGWTYEQRARGMATQYCGVGPMPGSGSNLSAWHHITGEFRGRTFVCFEHRYNNPNSANLAADRKRPVIEAVFMVSAPGSGPSMEILRPSRLNVLLDRRASMRLGITEFDDMFRIVTDDDTWVRNVLTDSMVSFLLSDPRAKESPLQLRNDELFTWYTGTLSPRALEEQLNYLCDVLDRIPAQAWTAA